MDNVCIYVKSCNSIVINVCIIYSLVNVVCVYNVPCINIIVLGIDSIRLVITVDA